jgi:hypothetical protein
MPFPKKKPDNEHLKHQVSTTLNQDANEVWHHLCYMQQKSSHAMLRELIEHYINSKDPKRDPYTAMATLRR